MIRVLSIVGTRPEGIKMAPVIAALARRADAVQQLICSTGQHREMLAQVLDLFGIVPDVDLALMQPGQTPTQVASRLLAAIEPLLRDWRPHWVLVQGDTTTVVAAALAAHYAGARVGHVEAGLRTYDRRNPFPEETNRVLADHLSDLCFAPTEGARRNLLREGIAEGAIRVTGNTVVDALQAISRRLASAPAPAWLEEIASRGRLILVTAHRRENLGAPLERICAALAGIAAQGDGAIQIVYPVHLNPRVRETVFGSLSGVPHVHLIDPVDYLTLVRLLQRSALVLTDSGGIQEEAPSLGVPVLVLRETTERPEAVEAGVARLVGADTERIVAESLRLLRDEAAHAQMARAVNPFGDGRAAERIVEGLLA
jgi:UDP-N-acetylglucosamine 2-epimerase (non-hydrolysing)